MAVVKKLYEVSASEKDGKYNTVWSVDVVAESARIAQKIGIDALEKKGLINRKNIKRSEVHCTNRDVWVEVSNE